MNGPSDDDLREVLSTRVQELPVPPGDLAAVRHRGHALRRRRRRVRAIGGSALALVLTSGVVSGLVLSNRSLGERLGPGPQMAIDPLGALDFSDGLRAYADPGVEIHLGGRTFPAADLDYLDTDAAATSFGVVFFQGQQPWLLRESGRSAPLEDEPVDRLGDFHPTAKPDSTAPRVAYAVARDGVVEITAYDLAARRVIDRHPLDCDDVRCADVVVDAYDDGVVFVRTDSGTAAWTVGQGYDEVAGEETRIADVRGGVVLYDGPEPTDSQVLERWRWVPGAIDSQLTFDGGHVLGWSSRLEPTSPDGEAVVLERGPERGLGFWTVDTDGSILVAAVDGTYPDYTVWDCEVPAGRCTELGGLRPQGGDPMFIGNDM